MEKENIFYAIIALIFGIVSIYNGINDYLNHSKLNNSTAQVISEPMTNYTEKTKYGIAVGYEIDPAFTPIGSNTTYKCHALVEKETIDQLQNNPVVTIRYIAEDPSICQVDGEAESNLSWFMPLIGIILTLGSIAYIYNAYSTRIN